MIPFDIHQSPNHVNLDERGCQRKVDTSGFLTLQASATAGAADQQRSPGPRRCQGLWFSDANDGQLIRVADFLRRRLPIPLSVAAPLLRRSPSEFHVGEAKLVVEYED
jgi:hypothetical protein